MAEQSPSVLLLTADLAPRGSGMDARLLISQLSRQGAAIRVICESAEVGLMGATIQESPGLSDPWRQPWVLRNLAFDREPGGPKILHVLSTALADAALWLAERWEIPYFVTVDEFLDVGERLRLSKKWCRGLFAAGDELATDLSRQMGDPSLTHSRDPPRPGILRSREPNFEESLTRPPERRSRSWGRPGR